MPALKRKRAILDSYLSVILLSFSVTTDCFLGGPVNLTYTLTFGHAYPPLYRKLKALCILARITVLDGRQVIQKHDVGRI